MFCYRTLLLYPVMVFCYHTLLWYSVVISCYGILLTYSVIILRSLTGSLADLKIPIKLARFV
jgi:hypothetical protein